MSKPSAALLSTGSRCLLRVAPVLLAAALAACSGLPTSGFSAKELGESVAEPNPATAAIQIVDVDESVTRQLLAQRQQRLFTDTFGGDSASVAGWRIGTGDVLEVSVWEASPATLFAATAPLDLKAMPAGARGTTFPEQIVGSSGTISIPFAGAVQARGREVQQIEEEIVERLRNKANQPQVLVRVTRNVSSHVTVVGEVGASAQVPLSPRGERLLDALAAAGGTRQPVNKTTIQLTRGQRVQALPLETVIRDPRQNVRLEPGDVITALFQPLSFTALGATGRNEEVPFEAQGITLAQALARVGGLIDARSNPQGIFIFRFEPRQALANWPRQPVGTTPEGLVPVVYRVDLKNPATFFVMQSFPMTNRDVLYVANAPVAELQKFLNAVFSIAYPLLNAVQATR